MSASMRTALLVYSGITVKMMVDSDLGALLTTMFMVQYDPAGWPVRMTTRSRRRTCFWRERPRPSSMAETYRLGAGDAAFAGVGCVHGFRNVGDGPVRWLETQAPQPPGRHSYRFVRDWDYLRLVTDVTEERHDMTGTVLIVGGTAGHRPGSRRLLRRPRPRAWC